MRKLILTPLIAILAACGGGGGGGGDDAGAGGGAAPLGAPAPLTSTNYVAANQEAYLSSNYLQKSGGLLTGAQVSGDPTVIPAMLEQVDRFGRWFAGAKPLVSGVVTTETEACPGGGNLTGTINDQNGNDNPDPGDSVVIVAANCVLDGYTVRGTIRAVFSAASGIFGEPPFSARLSMTAENFTVATAAASATGNGTIEVDISFPNANSGSITISTSSFVTTGGAQSTRTLANFTIRAATSRSGNTMSVSTTMNGSVSSTALGSMSVTVATVRPFVTVSPALYPSSGQLIVTGAANSKGRLTAQNATTVLIELDADGDGTYETSTTRRWSDFV